MDASTIWICMEEGKLAGLMQLKSGSDKTIGVFRVTRQNRTIYVDLGFCEYMNYGYVDYSKYPTTKKA